MDQLVEDGEIIDGRTTSDALLQSLFEEVVKKGPVDVAGLLIDSARKEKSSKKKKGKHKDRDKEEKSSVDESARKAKKKDKEKSKDGKKHKKHKDRHSSPHISEEKKDKVKKKKRSSADSPSKHEKHADGKPKFTTIQNTAPFSLGSEPAGERARGKRKRVEHSPSPPRRSTAESRKTSRRSPSPRPRHSRRSRSRSPAQKRPFKWGSPSRQREWDLRERWSRSRSRSWSPRRFARRRSRTRSPRPEKIDLNEVNRDELLEIAKKNAQRLYLEGKLSKNFINDNFKKKSIKDLIKLCEDISKRELEIPANESLVPKETGKEFDFTTLPVRSIRLNVGTAMQTKSALERLIEGNALKQTFPVSSGTHRAETAANWEPVAQSMEMVSTLSSKKVKIAPAFLFSDPPPAAPKPAAKPKKKDIVERLPPPIPKDPLIDWQEVLAPPPPPPTFAGFDAPAFTLDVPAPPKVIASYEELLDEEEREELLREEGEILFGDPDASLEDDAQLPSTSTDVAQHSSEENPGPSGTVYATSSTLNGHKPFSDLDARPKKPQNEKEDMFEVVRTVLRELVDIVAKDGKQTKASKFDNLAENSPRVQAAGKSVFGSFMNIPLFSQTDPSVLPLALSRWAEYKNKNAASFGVAPLVDGNMDPRVPNNSIWATKDTLRNAPEITGGIGAHLLRKMGWEPGLGLGRNMDGPVEPLVLDVKSDRKGLFSVVDKRPSRREKPAELNGKNPVSVIMEYCSKHGYPPPLFCPSEDGPPNDRRFGCRAVLNGVEYGSASAATNKKAAKAQVCLIMCRALNLC